MSTFLSTKDALAVDDLLSQAKDHYVLEQVSKINCSGFIDDDDSALTIDLETRFRRLKSLPVSSSSWKLLYHSKSTASQKNHGNAKYSSTSATSSFSGIIKRNPSVKTQDHRLGSFSESSGRNMIGSSSSSRFSRGTSKISSPTRTQQTLKFLPKEKSRISSSSSREGMKWKSKSRSWFDKFSLGCLQLGKPSSSKSKQQKMFWEEEMEKVKDLSLETQRIITHNSQG